MATKWVGYIGQDRQNWFGTGDWLASENGEYFALAQSDGNFVVYRGSDPSDPDKVAVWATGQLGSGSYFHIQIDTYGKLSWFQGKEPNTPGRITLWSAGDPENYGCGLFMGNDGILVISAPDDPNWRSHTGFQLADDGTQISEAAPALASLNGKLHYVVSDQESDSTCIASSTLGLPGSFYFQAVDLDPSYYMGDLGYPSLVSFKNRLFCVFISGSGWPVLSSSATGEPHSFGRGASMGITVVTTLLNLAEFKGSLYATFLNGQYPSSVNLMSSAAGSRFGNFYRIPTQDRSVTAKWEGPALASFRDKLYCAWVDYDSDRIMIASSTTGDPDSFAYGFADGDVQASQTAKTPALAVLGDKLYLAYVGGDQKIYVASSPTGDPASMNSTLSLRSLASSEVAETYLGDLHLSSLSCSS